MSYRPFEEAVPRLRVDPAPRGDGRTWRRPGFWHGPIPVSAPWLGGVVAIAEPLRRAARSADSAPTATPTSAPSTAAVRHTGRGAGPGPPTHDGAHAVLRAAPENADREGQER